MTTTHSPREIVSEKETYIGKNPPKGWTDVPYGYKSLEPVEPEYKSQLRRVIEANMVHANFEELICPDDKYGGCLGHKQKHIDIMVEKIWNMFRPVQVQCGAGEEKKI